LHVEFLNIMTYERPIGGNKCLLTQLVATLALGLQPGQRGYKVAGQEEARESRHILLGV
jgi:hypothetical protein